MRKSTVAIILGAAATVALTGYSYYNNVYNLRFALADIRISKSGDVGIMIAVHNPALFFGYPVPELYLRVYDKAGKFLGTLSNEQMQWIAAGGTSFIYAWVEPNYVQLISLVNDLLFKPGDAFTLDGIIKVRNTEIPLQTTLILNQ